MYNGKKVSVIIAAAGSGKRMGGGLNKQYINICDAPVLFHSIWAFERNEYVDEVLVTVKPGEEEKCRTEITDRFSLRKVAGIIPGGAERYDSVRAALKCVSDTCGIVLIHDGARPLVTDAVIDEVIKFSDLYGAVIPAVPVKDTVKFIVTGDGEGCFVDYTPDRNIMRAVQTPQGFECALLRAAYEDAVSSEMIAAVTDDASLVEAAGHRVMVCDGDVNNIKITTPEDVSVAELIMKKRIAGKQEHANCNVCRTGIGYDVHAFSENRKLILGGVEIPFEKGLLGHSDADVLLHAVMDALLGACGMGDIGKHFPDNDMRYKGISSLKLLDFTGKLLQDGGWRVVNIDAVVIAQKPKISPYTDEMKKNIAEVLKISASQINIKGTTTERLGFTGREEGIAAQSVAAIIHV